MITAQEIREILVVLKEFDVREFTLGDMHLVCNFTPTTTKRTLDNYKPTFPEAKYNAGLMSDITAEELVVLGLAGVAPVKVSKKKDVNGS